MLNQTEIPWISASEIVALTSTGRISVSEIAETMIEHLNAVNPAINAVVDFDPAQVRKDAVTLDSRFASREEVGPLFGVPFT